MSRVELLWLRADRGAFRRCNLLDRNPLDRNPLDRNPSVHADTSRRRSNRSVDSSGRLRPRFWPRLESRRALYRRPRRVVGCVERAPHLRDAFGLDSPQSILQCSPHDVPVCEIAARVCLGCAASDEDRRAVSCGAYGCDFGRVGCGSRARSGHDDGVGAGAMHEVAHRLV